MHDSRTLIPFSPTHVNEVNVGMKVCVTRSNGRMSRGIVKWIGTLPNNYGDFIGVELETESKFSDDYLYRIIMLFIVEEPFLS